jgi:signal transduction histidine kinase
VDQAISLKNKSRSYFRSSSFVMALLFTVMLGGASGILGYSGYYLNRNHFILGIEEILDTEYSYLKSAEASGDFESVINERLSKPNRIYYLTKDNHTFISGNISAYPSITENLKDGIFYFNREHTDEPYAAKLYNMKDGNKILIGSNMSDLIYTEHVILLMGAVTILLMMLVIIVSYLISNFVVSRTNHIAETARTIMQTGDLSQRIIIDSRWDDLSNMAYVLNNLLSRIEDLMNGIRRVSDNIAHDLRTPLTRLRNNMETLHRDTQNIKITHLIEEADHILSTFHAVLRISKIEDAPSKEHFSTCDIRKIISDVIDLYEPLAADKTISLDPDLMGPAPYHGDANLLFQMYANLLDNSIKFTPTGGSIRISLCYGLEGEFVTIIEDTGGGVSEADQKYVFDRFYRGEKSRSSEGNGLGLSMVRAIVMLHNGGITLENHGEGLRVIISL